MEDDSDSDNDSAAVDAGGAQLEANTTEADSGLLSPTTLMLSRWVSACKRPYVDISEASKASFLETGKVKCI